MKIQRHTTNGVSYLSAIPSDPIGPPVVLVHGAYNDAWIWSKTFLPWFASQGRATYALFLKPPETVSQWSTLLRYGLHDYEQQLAKMIHLLDAPPIVVGHSMGGLVVQRFLGKHPHRVRGACLLASLPPFGLKNALWAMVKHPYRLLQYALLTLHPAFGKKGTPPVGLLSSHAPDSSRLLLQRHLVRESARALAGCLTPGVDVAALKGLHLQVIGADLDNLALPGDVIRTAQLYGQAPLMYPAMGHFMMLEPGWQTISAHILTLG